MGIATGEVKHPIIKGHASGIKQPFTMGKLVQGNTMELLHTREYSADGIHSAKGLCSAEAIAMVDE